MSVRALVLTLAVLLGPLDAVAQPSSLDAQPMEILVHVTHGPEAPTRAALGFHVAKAALDEGHGVTIFLAGDAVQLLRQGTLDQLKGLGTGDLRALFDALVAGGAAFYLSGGSSQARGLTQADLGELEVTFGSPADLVRLAVEHDRMFTY